MPNLTSAFAPASQADQVNQVEALARQLARSVAAQVQSYGLQAVLRIHCLKALVREILEEHSISRAEEGSTLVPITNQMEARLRKLSELGIYGRNPGEVAERLICNELIRLKKEGVVE